MQCLSAKRNKNGKKIVVQFLDNFLYRGKKMAFEWIGKLLSSLFGKKKEGEVQKKPVHEKIHEGFYKKTYSELLGLRNRIKSIRDESGVMEARRELETLRREFRHMDRPQQRHLSGLFKECKVKIIVLEKKFKNLKRKELLIGKAA